MHLQVSRVYTATHIKKHAMDTRVSLLPLFLHQLRYLCVFNTLLNFVMILNMDRARLTKGKIQWNA